MAWWNAELLGSHCREICWHISSLLLQICVLVQQATAYGSNSTAKFDLMCVADVLQLALQLSSLCYTAQRAMQSLHV